MHPFKSAALLIVAVLFFSACRKPIENPAAIEDVRMEAGLRTDEVIFFARFTNAKGNLIPTEGTLEIQLLQDDREFLKTSLQLELDHFVPYGMGNNLQFQSKPISANTFTFQPKFNKVGWYNHTLKARFISKEGNSALTWQGGYFFKSIFDHDEQNPGPLK